MIDITSRPRLVSKARLRFDRHSKSYMLIYPERGLSLNATAAAVVELCDGEHSIAEIVTILQQRFEKTAPARIEHEVEDFMQLLVYRGLLEGQA